MEINETTVDEANRWRLETPGCEGWEHTARRGDPNKYLMISVDCHANEPRGFLSQRLDKKFRERMPHVEVDDKGVKFTVTDSGDRSRLLLNRDLEGEDLIRGKAGYTPEGRLRDHAADGVEAEIIFPNKGLLVWATRDGEFAMAQCRAYNDWAWETFGPYNERMSPMAAVAPADPDGAIAEIKRVAKLGFRGIALPCKPIYGAPDAKDPNYNLPMYDPLWATIQETGLPITYHISTGRDPRTARKDGGAVINYVCHSLSPTIEPIANMCASGVLERFPGLNFAAIECGIGWVPWALNAMDEAYHKHHMWVRPKLKMLPSEYFKRHGLVSFQEDPVGLDLAAKYGLVDNFMWANDYPHHEGSWPHSAQAIERQMGDLTDNQRAKILGLNAVRLFKFEPAVLRKPHPSTMN